MDNCASSILLFHLEPKNDSAVAVLKSRYNGDRISRPHGSHGQGRMLKVELLDKKQGLHGLISFGRHPQCGIRFEDGAVGLEHCCLNINPSSGEIILDHLSTASFTSIDGERVENPPMRALVFNHAKLLTLGSAVFEICWPDVPEEWFHEMREVRKARAASLLADADNLNMTNIQWDMFTAPVTQPLTRLRSVRSTPLHEPFTGPGPIEVQKLGEGAFAQVYLAVDRVSADFVAVKRLKKRISIRGMVAREIDMLCKLEHPNLVKMLSWRDTPIEAHLDLEYCSLGTLISFASNPATHIDEIWSQTACGLEYLHQNDIVHRDIKPANILVHQAAAEAEFCFKLADFGLCHKVAAATTRCGTPIFMAPEVISLGQQTPKLDVYSLGVTFLKVLGGLANVKISREPWHDYCDEVSEEASKFTPNDSRANCLRNMIKRDPDRRPTATQCLEFVRPRRSSQAHGERIVQEHLAGMAATQGNTQEQVLLFGGTEERRGDALNVERSVAHVESPTHRRPPIDGHVYIGLSRKKRQIKVQGSKRPRADLSDKEEISIAKRHIHSNQRPAHVIPQQNVIYQKLGPCRNLPHGEIRKPKAKKTAPRNAPRLDARYGKLPPHYFSISTTDSVPA